MSQQLTPPVSETDHSRGDEKAALVVVEYGDYECPHCGSAHKELKRLEEEGVSMRFIFRNFPLSESHANAFAAAMAAEAADRQGKFWEMHDYIFEHQDSLTRGHLPDMARAIGLDMDRYRTDMNAESAEQKVQDDFESGIRSGVNGTPSFYVNGNKFNGSISELASQGEKNLG